MDMKEWLKEYNKAYDIWYMSYMARPLDQFITDYLRDHPLPLPSDEEAGEVAVNETYGLSPFESFMAGVEFCREKMEGI